MATVTTAYPAQLGARTAQRNPMTKAKSANAFKKYNTGTVLNGGTPLGSNNISLSLNSGLSTKVFGGSIAVKNSELGTEKAHSSLPFAYFEPKKYIIPLFTTTLGGVAADALKNTGHAVKRRSIHFVLKDYLAKDATIGWDYNSGQHPTLTGLAATTTYTEKDGSATTSVDEAAKPTGATPGELAYRTGSPTVKQDDYKSKTNGGF